MAYNNHLNERTTCFPQQESTYLTCLIQQRKHFYGRKGTTSFDSQIPGKVGWSNFRSVATTSGTVSKYKKINVNTQPQVPLMDTRGLCAGSKPPQSTTVTLVSRKNSVSLTPAISDIQKSHPLPYTVPRGLCQNVPDFRSGRMYLNPHFFKANSSLQTGVTAENTAPENADGSTLKHSVHINPKVLAAQVMKLTTHSQPTQAHVVASQSAASNKHETKLRTCEVSAEPIVNNFTTMKHVLHSETKPVKQNVIVQQTSAHNMMRNAGAVSQFVQKRKLSPLIKSSVSGPLMSISRTKLVRAKSRRFSQDLQGLPNNRQSFSVPNTLSTRLKVIGKQSLLCSRVRRNSIKSSVLAVKAACSKFKLTRSNIVKTPVMKSQYNYATNEATSNQESRYKIDRRLYKTSKRLKKVKKYSVQYEMPKQSDQHTKNPKPFKYKKVQYSTSLKLGNKMWNNSLHPRRVTIINKKLRKIGSSPNLRKGREGGSDHQSSSLVRIGGVLYRTSKLKLTRSLIPKCKNQGGRSVGDHNVKKPKARSSFAVYVRGNKFLMDAAGKTLLRVPQSPTKSGINEASMRNVPVKRIDIGGVTFVQKSTNVLIRTNTHNARSLLSQAKQKSIALLTNKLRKSNQPCIFYHRFGRCVRKEKGTCPHVHDPKHVAVCKKFLQGCCAVTNCTLSHDVGPEKMPTCKYFLEGCCVRDSCPYLHVKVNAKAVICKNFLRGYCPDGQKCRKRHTYLCPEFEKAGTCPKGKYCPYPHKNVVRKKAIITQKPIKAADEAHATVSAERKRYYETGEVVLKEFGAEPEDPQDTNQVDSSDLNVKRLKLLKKVDDMKRAWQNAHCDSDWQINATSSLMPDIMEPEAKRPKLGILPAYIPLGSDP